MIRRTTTMRFLAALLLAPALAAANDHWPQWRGPSLDGRSDSTGLPLEWSETRNVKWKAKLPSWSGATPIIWGDRIFVPSGGAAGDGPDAEVVKKMGRVPEKESRDIHLLCVSKTDGKELWRNSVSGVNYHIGKQNMASPSPVTDGDLVWWLTGTGVLTALTMDGMVAWRTDLQKSYGKFGLNWGYGASPLLYEGLVIVPVLHGMNTDEPSYLVAFEGKTGKVAWKVERPTDALQEGPDAYTTPMPMKVGDRTEIVVVGGDYFTGHDPKSGKELWRCGGLNPEKNGKKDPWYRAVASPAIADDLIFGCIKTGPFVACKGGGQGLVTSTHVAWTSATNTCDVPTPVFDGKLLYVLNDRAFMHAVEPKTGKYAYEKQRLPAGTYSASPLLADGRLYVTNESGKTTVLAAGPEFRILAENVLDEGYALSSIAVSGKELFLRVGAHLYCISAK
jgi:outer membrane protein assembly factor BamB